MGKTVEAPGLIIRPSLQELVLAEQITDYIDVKDLFNYFVDTPEETRKRDPYEEFVQLCRTNLGWACRTLIGKGDFELLPFQLVIQDTLWNKRFPILLMTRGGGKSMMLAIYSILRAVLDQNSATGSKIVLVSASFRQTKLIMETIEQLISRSPLLLSSSQHLDIIQKNNDRWEIKIGNSTIIAIPLGDGQRIRGIRATDVITDEFGSVPEEIFNVVVQGFAAVNQNPVEKVRANFNKKKIIEMGGKPEDRPEEGNRVIRSGSATYCFNHFYSTYERYRKIIDNRLIGYAGEDKIKEVLGDEMARGTFIDYRNHAIIQLPYDAMPDGYMDKATIDEASMRMSKDQFRMEYKAEFITDSIGFFKASAIDQATPRLSDAQYFEIELEGDPNGFYVMGLDPARLSDDFGLFILRVTDAGARVVYAYRWDKKNFGLISKEIRRLYKAFNIKRIGIDQGGGGSSIKDFLQTPEMADGDPLFWEIEEKHHKEGYKVLDMINYMGAWLKSANYDMAADIEHRRLLFPYCANISSGNAKLQEKADEIFGIILQAKAQLTNIEVTLTEKSETEHFDVPAGTKKINKKDLYSALLLASYEARAFKGTEVRKISWGDGSMGGFVEDFGGGRSNDE